MSERTENEERLHELSPEDRATLCALLDTVIPPSEDGTRPGAGELGLVEAVELEARRDPVLAPELTALLGAVREAARAAGRAMLHELDEDSRVDVARRLESEMPETFARILVHTCKHYYQHAKVVSALGLDARPPFPTGFDVAPTDLALLDAVRARAPMYRKC